MNLISYLIKVEFKLTLTNNSIPHSDVRLFSLLLFTFLRKTAIHHPPFNQRSPIKSNPCIGYIQRTSFSIAYGVELISTNFKV